MEIETTEAKPNGNGRSHAMKMTNADGGIFWPEVDNGFVLTSQVTAAMIQAVGKMSERSPQNLLVTGPQGCGKTELVTCIAAAFGRPMYLANLAIMREPKDLFGYKEAKAGTITYRLSDFVRAIEMGNCVVGLDEGNRMPPAIMNGIYGLLDWRRAAFVEDIGRMVTVGPGTIFVMTCNIGFSHHGTFQMDSALEDRFAYHIELDFPPEKTEAGIIAGRTGIDPAIAKKLAKFAYDLRRKAVGDSATLNRPVSTRQMIATAELMREFEREHVSLLQAFEFTVLPNYPKDGGNESEQAQVRQLIQGVFGQLEIDDVKAAV